MTIQLRGMTWDHPRAYEPLLTASDEFAKSHPGVAIQWEKRSLQAFADHPLADLAARYDLIVIDHPHVGQAARERCLLPLDGAGHDDELTTLARQSLGVSHSSYHWDGRQWALALDAAAQVAAYRPDLLEVYPRTWHDVLTLAKAGRVLWPVKPVDALMSFFTLAANFGKPCAQGDLLIAVDDGRCVLDAMKRLCDLIPRECLAMNPPQTLDRMSTEDTFAYCPLLYGYSNYARPGASGMNESGQCLVRFADIPALGMNGPVGSTIGGTGMAVSAASKHIETAVDFAFFICSADVQRGIYFKSGGQPANAMAWDDPAVNAASSHFFADTRQTLDHAYLRPRHDGYMTFQDRGGDLVHAHLSGHTSADQTIHDLNDAYRASLQNK